MNTQLQWDQYIDQMEHILGLKLENEQRNELLIQLNRISNMAELLMSIQLDDRLELSGVFHP